MGNFWLDLDTRQRYCEPVCYRDEYGQWHEQRDAETIIAALNRRRNNSG